MGPMDPNPWIGLGLDLSINGWVGLGLSRVGFQNFRFCTVLLEAETHGLQPMGWVGPFEKRMGWVGFVSGWVGFRNFDFAQCCLKQKPMGPNAWVGPFRKTDGLG